MAVAAAISLALQYLLAVHAPPTMSRLIWHRRDLRIRDNELYHGAARRVYSVYVFDPAEYAPRTTGIADERGGQLLGVTNGPHFTRRLLRAVHSLRRNLRSIGGDLIVRVGNPQEVIPTLAKELRVDEVAWSEVPGHYEHIHSERLKDSLLQGELYRCSVYTTCSLTLAHPKDLPTDQLTWQQLARPKEKKGKKSKKRPPQQSDGSAKEAVQTINYYGVSATTVNMSPSRFVGMPTVMGDFRRVARTSAPVRELFPEPNHQQIAKADCDVGDIPSLESLTQSLLDSTKPLLGCLPKELIQLLVKSARDASQDECIYDLEEQSIGALEHFVQNHAASADRSLCDVSDDDSSKLSVPLALGLLSPQQVYNCVKQQQNRVEGEEAAEMLNWLISHMEMRDFFLFDSFRNGSSAYHLHPKQPAAHRPNTEREWLPLSANQDAFQRWASGRTNLPLVDAGMRELITTGYTSNRARQNMASVLTKDLHLDWRLGCEFYQLCLEDHCVAANCGNWRYFAGVGGDPKNRHFRTVSQAARYDPEGKFVRKWIDRLSNAGDVEAVLRPWDFIDDWGAPIVPSETQLTWQDKEKLGNLGRIR